MISKKEEEAPFRGIIVVIGLILLIAGVAIPVLFPAQEALQKEVVTVKEGTFPSTLGPQNSTFFAYGPINRTMWFKLNISSSDPENLPAPVKVTISLFRAQRFKDPIFEQTGSSFNQTVDAPISGTYSFDIKNENPFSVTLEGNVLIQRTDTNFRTIYPYTVHGFLIMLVGVSTLIFGIFKKPKKASRVKSVRRKTKLVQQIDCYVEKRGIILSLMRTIAAFTFGPIGEPTTN